MKDRIRIQGMLTVVLAVVILGLGPAGHDVSGSETMAVHVNQHVDSNSMTLPVDIVFVLDNSGSMIKNDPRFITRQVVTDFVNTPTEGWRLGMVIFDQKASLVEPLMAMDDPESASAFIKGLAKLDYRGRFTDTPAGVERALYELKENGREGAQKVLVLLTDGIVDTGNKAQDLQKSEWLKEDLLQESKAAGIRIFGIAFTDDADFRLIQIMASRTDGAYFRAYTAEDIPAVFEKITEAVAQMTAEPDTSIPAETPPQDPELQQSMHGAISPDLQEPMRENRYPLPLVLAGIVVVVLILVFLAAFRRKKIDRIAPVEIKDKVADELPPDHPVFKAELIDVDHVISDESVSLMFNKLLMSIGRDPGNDVVIPKDSISSLHATIEYKNGYFYLEDHRSTNGTRLNNKELKENQPARLKSGDKIHFAVYEFRFLMRDQAPFGATVLLEADDI